MNATAPVAQGEAGSNGSRVVMVAEKITKHYPGTVALDQVDFTVYSGAVNVLVGDYYESNIAVTISSLIPSATC
jgi:ABC-type phosphonate transport system ATPase subunit